MLCKVSSVLDFPHPTLSNSLTGHPYEPTIAASGLDNTIKIFSPDQHAQDQARSGINILDPDNPMNLLGRSIRNIGGLQSRKRLSDSYRIISQNDVDRCGGMSEAYITVGEAEHLDGILLTCAFSETCCLALPPLCVVDRPLERALGPLSRSAMELPFLLMMKTAW